jgi:hypothetical protein
MMQRLTIILAVLFTLIEGSIQSFEKFIKYAPPHLHQHIEQVKATIRQLKSMR